MTEMKIKAIAPWFGAKRVLADRVIAEFGKHRAYWEPMCGSLAILLAKPDASQETVSDLHGGITCLARTLADETDCVRLYGRLARTLASEQLFLDSVEFVKASSVPDGPDVDYAYHFFILSWIGRNGVAGTSSYNQGFSVRYTSNGGIQGTRFCAAVDSIPAWHLRLREVTILRRNVFEVLERIEDSLGTVIYLDPPYIEKGAKYIHDFDPEDHDKLANSLQRFARTRVCVSYYAHPKLEKLYPKPKWTMVRFDVSKALVNQGMRDRKGETVKAPEVLLINQTSLTANNDLF